MTVPKIEATDRTISSPMVRRREERPSQIEERKSLSFLLAKGYPGKKMALSFAQRQQNLKPKKRVLLLMAFGAVGFLILAESLRAVMANAAMLVLSVGFLRHLQIFFLHLEDFGVTVRAFQLVLSYMKFVTEGDRTGAALGFKLDVPAAHLFLLGIGQLKSCKT